MQEEEEEEEEGARREGGTPGPLRRGRTRNRG